MAEETPMAASHAVDSGYLFQKLYSLVGPIGKDWCNPLQSTQRRDEAWKATRCGQGSEVEEKVSLPIYPSARRSMITHCKDLRMRGGISHQYPNGLRLSGSTLCPSNRDVACGVAIRKELPRINQASQFAHLICLPRHDAKGEYPTSRCPSTLHYPLGVLQLWYRLKRTRNPGNQDLFNQSHVNHSALKPLFPFLMNDYLGKRVVAS